MAASVLPFAAMPFSLSRYVGARVSRAMRVAHVSASLVLGGTASLLAACSPSVNQAYKSSIDQRVGALQTSSSHYDAPGSPEPMPIAVGQWSRYKLVDSDGHPGFITYSVVGEEGGAYWLEMLQEGYTSRLVTLMLVDLGDRRNPSTVDVKQMKQKTNDDAVNELPASMLSLMKPMYSSIIDSLIVDLQDKPQEAAEVPAGSFDGCYKVQASVSFAGKSYSSTGWSHPAVPLSGAVKTRGIDNPSAMDLVEFGTSGAKSELM